MRGEPGRAGSAVGGRSRTAVGLLVLVVGGAGLLWLADLAQLAGDTTEPQLVEARVVLLGVPAALLWAVATTAAVRVLHPRGATRVVVGLLAVLPWLVLGASCGDVLREVCARPGGRCG